MIRIPGAGDRDECGKPRASGDDPKLAAPLAVVLG